MKRDLLVQPPVFHTISHHCQSFGPHCFKYAWKVSPNREASVLLIMKLNLLEQPPTFHTISHYCQSFGPALFQVCLEGLTKP